MVAKQTESEDTEMIAKIRSTASLHDLQVIFSQMLAHFIIWLEDSGYEVVVAEVARSAAQAEINALGFRGRQALCQLIKTQYPELSKKILDNNSTGIRGSLHELRLAADLLLFKDDKYLTKTEEYRIAGEHWEKMGGTWGGRFSDGNHFSIAYGGKK